MQGAPKRQVNAEDMLAELKRALESSTRAPDAPPPSASTVPKPRSPDRESRRSQIDGSSGRPAKANAEKSIGPRTDIQKSTRPSSRSWKLIAGAFALAAAAAICVGFALTNKAPDSAEREPSVAAAESQVRPQPPQSVEPTSSPGARMQDSPQAAPLQADKAEARPATPASAPAPLSQAATLVTSHRIGPDGAPIATTPSTPALPESSPPLAEAPKTPAPSAAPQAIRPDRAPSATAPSTPTSPNSTPSLAEAPKTPAPSAAAQAIRQDRAPSATAPSPSTPASPVSTPPLAEAPKTMAPSAAAQAIQPDRAPSATAPSSLTSPNSTPPLAEAPKPNATPTASASNESAEPSTPKADVKKKPLVKTAQQKLLGSPKPPVKPIARAERQSTEPAPPKEAEKSPQPAQDAASPTAVAPLKPTSVQQRVADGVTHAFGYLVHLPGALVPHLGGPTSDAH
jgi:hypothetical protein